MKKIYLSITLLGMFILMFMITLVPTQALSIYGPEGSAYYDNLTLDTPIDELDGNSLYNVFYNYNLLKENNYGCYADSCQDDNNYTILNSDTETLVYPQFDDNNSNIYLETNDVYYFNVKSKVSHHDEFSYYLFVIGNNSKSFYRTDYTQLSTYSDRIQYLAGNNRIQFRFYWDSGLNGLYKSYYYSKPLVINLTYYNLEHLSNSELDYFYSLYQMLIAGIDPQVIYDIGYDDGENYGYLDGYNDGLTEGYFDGQYAYHTGTYIYDYTEGTSFIEGLQTGYNNGVDYAVQNNISILSIAELILGVALNMITFIITIDVFGISILSIISVLSLMVGAVWILKMVRG